MFTKYKKIIPILLVLLILQVGLIYVWLNVNTNSIFKQFSSNAKLTTKNIELNLDSHDAYYMSKSFYDQAYTQGTSDINMSSDKVYGGIIPHHMLPKEKIAAWFMGLAKTDYETVVLIGPNHYEVGSSNIIISQNKWRTPYGEIFPDLKIGQDLANNKVIEINEDPFLNEHSISGLVPFIKNSLPEAKILPIILKLNTPQKDLDYLANYLADNTNKKKTLVLASVDFSHYQPLSVANFHDQTSQTVIEDFDLSRVHNLELDSPGSIYAVLKYLENIEAQKANLVLHTNSSGLLKMPEEPGTSHLYYYFSKGKPSNQNGLGMMFFGDLMLDRNVKTKIEANGIGYIFDQLAGEENRFFMGSDIVSANLEGSVTNNGDHYPPEASIDFAIDPKYLAAIKDDYYFNYFNLANNHIWDQGTRGMEETAQNLNKLDLDFSGCADAMIDTCTTKIINIGDSKISMASFSMVYNQFDLEAALEKITELKSNTDLVITQIHWGVEYDHQFNQTQQNLAHQMIDAGADMIIGHHPHVVQGIEVYKNKPIFYSLGNFVFDQYFSKDTQQELGIGIYYEQNKYNIHLFPINSSYSQLSLMQGTDKASFLEKIVTWSNINPEIANQIRQGEIILK